MYKKRLRPLPMLLVLTSGLLCLFQLQVAGDLTWPSTSPHEPTAFIFTPSTTVAASPAVPSDVQLPPHTKRQPWGSGWECQRGYRQEGERCIEVDVPPHTFLDSFGHDWECERSYRREGECCVPVQVPEHAYLAYSGHGWACNDGYQRVDQTCEPLPGERLTQTTSAKGKLAQLATQVYANRRHLMTARPSSTCNASYNRPDTIQVLAMVFWVHVRSQLSDNFWPIMNLL